MKKKRSVWPAVVIALAVLIVVGRLGNQLTPPTLSPAPVAASTTVEERRARAAAFIDGDYVVSRIIDGDTFDVLLEPEGEDTVRIRLFGVDAPERGEPWADEATAFVTYRLLNQTVRLEKRDIDRFARVVADTFYRDEDGQEVRLSRILLEEGLAVWFERFAADDEELAMAQAHAQGRSVGLWE